MYFVEAIKCNSNLLVLNLGYADIGREQGAKCIAEAIMGNCTLQRIELERNEIGDK